MPDLQPIAGYRFNGALLRTLRKKEGWKLGRLAEILTTDLSLVSKWETYKANPSSRQVQHIKTLWPDVDFQEPNPVALNAITGFWILFTNLWSNQTTQACPLIVSVNPQKDGTHTAWLLSRNPPHLWKGTWSAPNGFLQLKLTSPDSGSHMVLMAGEGIMGLRGHATIIQTTSITAGTFTATPFITGEVMSKLLNGLKVTEDRLSDDHRFLWRNAKRAISAKPNDLARLANEVCYALDTRVLDSTPGGFVLLSSSRLENRAVLHWIDDITTTTASLWEAIDRYSQAEGKFLSEVSSDEWPS